MTEIVGPDDPRFIDLPATMESVGEYQLTDQLVSELAEYGMTDVRMALDTVSEQSYLAFHVAEQSPVERILAQVLPVEDETDMRYANRIQRVVEDIATGQFEKNWADYL